MNNIITSNYVYGIHADSTSHPSVSYNDVWGNGWSGYADFYGTNGGMGGISKDPRFVSFFDAHLLCSSPAINTANPNSALAPLVDYDNQPRPVGGRLDMGALEKQSELFCPLYLPLVLR